MTVESRTLVLLRHGESEWNTGDRFAGWVDVGLTEQGRAEARRSGELLTAADLRPDVVHTSVLRRAITTANIVLEASGRDWVDVHRTWRLNERHYGALQGLSREQVRRDYGDDQFARWRRSYRCSPPPAEPGSEFGRAGDDRYRTLGVEVPAAESIHDVLMRVLPYWWAHVAPDLLAGRVVVLVAHGNSLRALIRHLDHLTGDDMSGLHIRTGVPIRYDLTPDLRPRVPGGRPVQPG
ncbi:2,3-bisphosphoglycerate-dependent phosphoglycerate mutase [Tsukamurella soli]|uniref:2,3-bisphosphoglycerate-dependent phosphoglycerate mutase n=1 Tax=Tsukamurella soli TaxID=644556 RepID=A0ABP8JFJ7_9ACTN